MGNQKLMGSNPAGAYGSVGGAGNPGQQRHTMEAPTWERTPWWSWRRWIRRETWRIFRGDYVGGRQFGGWVYQTDRKRARHALEQAFGADYERPTRQGSPTSGGRRPKF